MAYELNKFGLVAEQEVAVPVYYEEIKFDCGYRIDILVNRCQVAQGLTYMRFSNNGDSEKVLATVVATIYAFTDKYPNAMIYATGSTKTRTRLYRMGISRFIGEVKQDFDVQGELKDDWADFDPYTEYDGFLVRRKK